MIQYQKNKPIKASRRGTALVDGPKTLTALILIRPRSIPGRELNPIIYNRTWYLLVNMFFKDRKPKQIFFERRNGGNTINL